MIILGIDPGVATTGFAIIKRVKDKQIPEVIDFGCILTDASLNMADRLKFIHSEVEHLIKKHQPKIVSVESIFFFKNAKTVMPVSQAKGVILLAAAQKNIPIFEFTPLQVKMTVVGYGQAKKQQVQRMTKELLDLSSFNIKEKSRKKDDATDALGIALCAFFQDRINIL